ncbi:heterokaryon incompatibility protein-domain-containing protein [Phaeosphaeriaceae sp. PMI808]|nr:heterokaryon incompatibility protein-domain-containing protein [Phaeosphaeriaceae sp. PMI808]
MPTRVLDLSNYPKLKVLKTGDTYEPYCALSYRWPHSPDHAVCLTSNTHSQFSEEIDCDGLPETIKAACILAHQIGVRNLWVDALCIIQGPGGDWLEESHKMATVYRNALFTIAVVDDVSIGDILTKPIVTEGDRHEAESRKQARASRRYLCDKRQSDYREQGNLDTRAWAFQERHLSPRVVSLTNTGLYWDCLCYTASHHMAVEIPKDISPMSRNSDERALTRILLRPNHWPPSHDSYRLWRAAVQNYTARDLTVPSDRHIAMVGIEKQMGISLKDESVLGIWRKDALRSLLWFAKSPSKLSSVIAPSWSWLSVNTLIEYRLFGMSNADQEASHEAKLVPKAKILDVHATSEISNGLASYKGQLEIHGPLSEIVIYDGSTVILGHYRGAMNARMLKDMAYGEESDQWLTDGYPDWGLGSLKRDVEWDRPPVSDSEWIEGGEFVDAHCMFVYQSNWELGARYGIVLQKTGQGQEYRRLGICTFSLTPRLCLESRENCSESKSHGSLCMGNNQTVFVV